MGGDRGRSGRRQVGTEVKSEEESQREERI